MSIRILTGDCRAALASLPDESVNCIVTSPPYYGLRSYLPDGHPDKHLEIGLEQTPDEYVAAMVSVFREARRVLRSDGVLWLNIGDSFAGSGKGGNPDSGKQSTNRGSQTIGVLYGTGKSARENAVTNVTRKTFDGIKAKDLIGIPWMMAFALRSDGWWLRGDHVWGKPNGMPESVEDRPTRGHEYVFLLTKSDRYWFDQQAVRTAPKASTVTRLAQDVENQKGSTRANGGGKTNGPHGAVGAGTSTITGAPHGRHSLGDAIPVKERRSDKQRGHTRRHAGFNDRWDEMERCDQIAAGANLRSVWWVPPAQYRGAHFAVMPDLVAEICIRSGCPEGGTVLDPFFGAGTTGVVADRLGRDCIGIELSEDNAEQAADRIRGDAAMFADVVVEAAA